MKTRIVILSAILFASLQLALASELPLDNDKYVDAMKKNIDVIYKAQSIEELQQSVNAFERIGAAEKTKWEPHYYAAFGYIMMANQEKEASKKDTYLDQAMASLDKAKAIVANESEVVALEGFVHMIRVTVDPGSRGPQYAGLAMQTYGKAIALNPENPRALALLAQMQYGTAQFFGSPATEACETTKKSLEKFDTFKSDNPLAPQWGRRMAEGMREVCK